MKHNLTGTPTALPGITAGQRYFLQNRSPHPVNVVEAAAQPTDLEDAAVMTGFGTTLSVGHVEPAAGESVWVWAAGAAGGVRISGVLFYDEAV